MQFMSNKNFQAVIFDLDGVITKTALVHSAAWKEMFDEFLTSYYASKGLEFKEFTHKDDYLPHVDGKPRYNGVADFLASREIELPYGDPTDSPTTLSICGLGNRKNQAFNEVLQRDGVEVYPTTVRLMKALREEGYRLGVASSSKNCEAVLKAAGLSELVETRVDGVVSAELGLKGKPEADIFIQAAKNLGCEPAYCVVVEDAVSGVKAGQNGNFGLVIGLAREDNMQHLFAAGADVVFDDLGDFGINEISAWFDKGILEDGWSISYYDYEEKAERSRESLLTIGNGYFGTRGALEETSANAVNYPGTYMAGMYNRLISRVSGRDIENEDFVNLPNWLSLKFRINGGDWIVPDAQNIVSIHRKMNFRKGLLERELIVQDIEGRQTKINSKRFVSMDNIHIAAMKYELTPLNYEAEIELWSGIDGDIINEGVERYKSLNQQHLQIVETGVEDDKLYLLAQTTQSKHQIAIAVHHDFSVTDGQLSLLPDIINSKQVYHPSVAKLVAGQSLKMEKIAAICSDKEEFVQDAHATSLSMLREKVGFSELLLESSKKWEQIWDKIDIKIEGDRWSQRMLRLHLYHLMVSVSPFNTKLDASITARGLHGEAYRGHIFWDELYILPFYDIHFPEVAKSMLMYRYRRLDKAREYAAAHGYKGAMFPWQSGSDGREETQIVHLNPLTGEWGDDYSSLQRHVSLAIAYNIWDYFWITNDRSFLSDYGMEMFFEICRFWASKAVKNPKTKRFEISGVMGPDEFHEHMPNQSEGGLKDNAYTNIMAAWMFSKVNDIIQVVGEQYAKDKGFTSNERRNWEEICVELTVPMNEEGIIAQYDGYFDLKELDWDYYREKYGNVYRMDRILKAEGKSPDDFKVAKQADTLMTFYNLNKHEVDDILSHMGYELPENYLAENLDYYLKCTSHGSTLSRLVHARLASIANQPELSWNLYQDALGSDFSDIQGGTTGEGIHAGVMAGTILITLNTYAGLNYREQELQFNPKLPNHWKKMEFKLSFKQINYQIILVPDKLQIKADQSTHIRLYAEQLHLEKELWHSFKL